MSEPAITIDSHLPLDWAEGAMRDDISRAFSNSPKVLPPKWLYDDRGSDLFDQITRLPEYYPTEAERAILAERSAEIAAKTGATTVAELGSGTSDKTRTLLDAFWATGQLKRFVPLDVSEATLLDAAEMLASRYEGLQVHAVVGDFTRHLQQLPIGGRRLVAFLGGTLGNFYEEERRAFLGALGDSLEADEWVLLGVDVIKPIEQILAAYNDQAGLTADFIKNVLTVLNSSLAADFDPALFDYIPFWDGLQERVDMRLRVETPHTVRIDALELVVEFTEGEEIRVEISTKFRVEKLRAELAEAGFDVTDVWTGEADDFGPVLARRI